MMVGKHQVRQQAELQQRLEPRVIAFEQLQLAQDTIGARRMQQLQLGIA
jgi:hypothetical protein